MSPGAGMGPETSWTEHTEDYLRQLQVDLSTVQSEQEYLRRLEAALPHPLVEVRVAVFGLLISQALSVLKRYWHQYDWIPQKWGYWNGQLAACTVGSTRQELQHSHYPGGVIYKVSIVGAVGVDPHLAKYPSYSMPNDVARVTYAVSQNLYRAQECRFRLLHAELRAALVDVGWLQDDFGHVDADTKGAAARQQQVSRGRRGAG